jgi:hypothetical protein
VKRAQSLGCPAEIVGKVAICDYFRGRYTSSVFVHTSIARFRLLRTQKAVKKVRLVIRDTQNEAVEVIDAVVRIIENPGIHVRLIQRYRSLYAGFGGVSG